MTDDCREAFEKKFKTLDLAKTRDAWDRTIYAHSHIQAMFEGYEAAWNARTPAGDAHELNLERILEIANTHSNFLHEGKHVFSDTRLKEFAQEVVNEYCAALSAKPGISALIAEVREKIKAAGDSYYCKALDLADKNCRGSQYKLENGKFTDDDLKWHCKHHELIGKHRGLYEALEKLTAAMKDKGV